MSENTPPSKSKLILGVIILVLGFLSPLLIPVVTNTDWPVGMKTFVSGILAFGVPELFMLLAVVVMGKPGYEYIKQKVWKFMKPLMPPDKVSQTRYKFGLVLFCIPIFFGVAEPYLAYFFPKLKGLSIVWYLVLDAVFVSSLFVLGGDFWDKIRALFKHDAHVCTYEQESSG